MYILYKDMHLNYLLYSNFKLCCSKINNNIWFDNTVFILCYI